MYLADDIKSGLLVHDRTTEAAPTSGLSVLQFLKSTGSMLFQGSGSTQQDVAPPRVFALAVDTALGDASYADVLVAGGASPVALENGQKYLVEFIWSAEYQKGGANEPSLKFKLVNKADDGDIAGTEVFDGFNIGAGQSAVSGHLAWIVTGAGSMTGPAVAMQEMDAAQAGTLKAAGRTILRITQI